MAISCLGFNTMACFPVKYSRSTTLQSRLIWYFDFILRSWFVQSLETLPLEITKIFDWQANILNQSERSVRWRTDRLKEAPRPCRRFFKLLPPQSPSGFSALARLYYFARPTKTAMLRRLNKKQLALHEMCVASLRFGLWADLWPFYRLYCERFSLLGTPAKRPDRSTDPLCKEGPGQQLATW